ncbi:hypothetical protein QQ008_20500 [Fulvivirgaceae bacterium BMA10]|uniref:Lipoprotein n=1 Tax=Splendidivirga corallicola TaxID=3051826 RepID=A0ABT8KUI0_9BACT|nr:hypothetical protein [Fulvivirgaceae bacterium BMA10]
MKRLLLLLITGLVLTSCEIYVEGEVIYDPRDKFLGAYEVDEYSVTLDAYSVYDVHVTKSYYDDGVIFINNFYGVNIEIFGTVSGSRVTIPLQEVNYYQIEGHGSIIGGELRLNYTVTDLDIRSNLTDHCNAVALKL